ncbi:ATP synthase, subunit E [Lasioglossum baleicum]|uniref:ATP synthase, subunit E n=1 Tax=Lasioglossum baleicum TaxID=434251 RepID=UPI003FCDED5D
MSSVEVGSQPVRVSPLIKFSRWSFLLLGIAWGTYHQRRFSKKEALLREKELAEKPMRDAKLAAERKLAQEAEKKLLEDLESGRL